MERGRGGEVPFFSVEEFIFRWAGTYWVGISSNEGVRKKFMEKGRSPEALISFALILLSLISNVPRTSRQILRKQIDRKLKKRKGKTTIEKANFLYHIYLAQCQTLTISRPVRCATRYLSPQNMMLLSYITVF